MDQDRVVLVNEAEQIPREDNTLLNKYETFHQYFSATIATISALAAGSALAWTSPILSEIQNGHYNNIPVNNDQMGWIGSLITIGAFCICFPAGIICDLIRRKFMLLLLILPFGTGWALLIWATNLAMLYVGRFLIGLAVGGCCIAAPLYIMEIAHKDIRGAVGNFYQLLVSCGVLYSYLMGDFLSITHYTVACALIPVIFVILFAFHPESPVYLIKKGKFEEAKKSLTKLRGPHYNLSSEIFEIESSVKESRENTVSFKTIMRRRSTQKGLLISLTLMFLQQFSGINVIILYSSDVFEEANSSIDSRTGCIIIGVFLVIGTFASLLVIDKLGRRCLLMVSGLLMGISTLSLGIFFSLHDRHLVSPDTIRSLSFLPIVTLCLFYVAFAVGLGPIPWMISSEIFIPAIKGMATSLASSLNWFLAFIITKYFLNAKECVGADTVFYVFTFCSLIGVLFVYFIVPETKGKTVNEVQELLEN